MAKAGAKRKKRRKGRSSSAEAAGGSQPASRRQPAARESRVAPKLAASVKLKAKPSATPSAPRLEQSQSPWAQRHFTIALTVAVLGSLVPLWSARFLPMIDVPQHLMVMHIKANLAEPALRYSEYFMERPGFTPYVFYYGVVEFLSTLLPLEVANRVFLSIQVAGLPVATAWLLRSLGRDPWLSLLAVPLAYDFCFKYGFVGQSVSVVLMLCCLAAYVEALRGTARARWWDALLVLLPVACVAAHPVPFALFMGALVSLALVFRDRALPVLLRTLPACGLMLTWAVPSLTSEADAKAMSGRLRLHSLQEHLETFPEYVFGWFEGSAGVWALVAFTLALGAAFGLSRRPRGGAPLGVQGAIWLWVAAAAAAYAFLPWDFRRILILYPRFAVVTCLALILAVPLRRGAVPLAFGVGLLVATLIWDGYLVAQFRSYSAGTGDLEGLAARMEPRSCVAPFRKYISDGIVRGAASHSHDSEYLALFSNSIPGYTFAYTPHSPIALRREDGSQATGLLDSRLPVVLRGSPRQAEYVDFYRYFLVPLIVRPADVFGPYAKQIHEVGRAGAFALYENPRGRCGK